MSLEVYAHLEQSWAPPNSWNWLVLLRQ